MLMVCVLLFAGSLENLLAKSPVKYDPEVYPGWKQSVQAYSFNHFTFDEAIDKVESLGLKNM